MIQYKKLKIIKGSQIIGYLYFEEGELLTIESFKDYLLKNNLQVNITDAEIQDIIDRQLEDIESDQCCTAPIPSTPVINYLVVDSNTINFNISNYNPLQNYSIQILENGLPLSILIYTEPKAIDLDPGTYTFVITVSSCAGTIVRNYTIEIGDISVTLNLIGNLSSTNITDGTKSVVIPSFVGDSIVINSSVIDQISNLWYINSVLINGVDTKNNEVYTLANTNTNNVLTGVSFTISNIQQSIVIDINSQYNTVEWCQNAECIECIYP